MEFRSADVRNAIGQVFPFDLSPSYGVTEYGDVVRLDTWRLKRPSHRYQRGGYFAVSLWEQGKERRWYVHQIVAHVFHGPRPSPKHDCAHTDGNKRNNHYTNLRWCTRADNEHDKIEHGRSNRGDRNGMSAVSRARRGQ